MESIEVAGVPEHNSEIPRVMKEGGSESKSVLLVSGLEMGGTTDPFPAQLLLDYITGVVGSPIDQQASSRITKMIVAGSSMNQSVVHFEDVGASAVEQAKALSPLEHLDAFLAQVASSIPVDVMPGATDPTTSSLPQKPLNRAIIPLASRYSTVNNVTNPHDFVVDDVAFLGTSGQPIDNMRMFMREGLSSMDLLCKTLEWRHIAPTAPDTLACFPYATEDPFVIENSPHVYFCANQDKFETRKVKTVKGEDVTLICIPRFSSTSTAVLLDLETLDATPISFSYLGPDEEGMN